MALTGAVAVFEGGALLIAQSDFDESAHSVVNYYISVQVLSSQYISLLVLPKIRLRMQTLQHPLE